MAEKAAEKVAVLVAKAVPRVAAQGVGARLQVYQSRVAPPAARVPQQRTEMEVERLKQFLLVSFLLDALLEEVQEHRCTVQERMVVDILDTLAMVSQVEDFRSGSGQSSGEDLQISTYTILNTAILLIPVGSADRWHRQTLSRIARVQHSMCYPTTARLAP